MLRIETDNGDIVTVDNDQPRDNRPTDHCATCTCPTCQPDVEIKDGRRVVFGAIEAW